MQSLLCSTIFWSALGALGTVAAFFASVFIALKLSKFQEDIAKKEAKTKQVELKILMFENRFKVYNCVRLYAATLHHIKQESDQMMMPDQVMIPMNQFVSSFLYSSRVTDGPKNPKFVYEMLKLFMNDVNVAAMAEFCFCDTRIAKIMLEFVQNIGEYSINGDKNDKLLQAIKDFEEFQVLDYMKKELKIAHEDLN